VRRGEVRLVTLTGPPGIGKTRLGLQVAVDLQDAFADGARFVPLTSVRDSSLVLHAIARVIGVQELGGQSILDLLVNMLQGKHVLLLLDNFEHVAAQTSPQQAARLLGASAAQCEAIGYQFDMVDQAAYDQHVAAVRAQLDPATFEAAWAAGQALSLEQAIAEAEAVATAAQAASEPRPQPLMPSTRPA
jgi:hypothetical protein